MVCCVVTDAPPAVTALPCPARANKMFSSSRGGGGRGGVNAAAKLLENNSIACHYDVGKAVGSGGPEGVWKLYEARAKSDGKVRWMTVTRNRAKTMESWKI